MLWPQKMPPDPPNQSDETAGLTPEQRIQRACELYAAGKISRGPAARLARLTRSEFDHELFRRQIPSYTTEMFEEDLATLSRIREESPE